MIQDFQIKGLEKLVNTSVIKDIYPMVDHIEITRENSELWRNGVNLDRLNINIFLNDSSITKKNMYYKDFDPHYLVDGHVREYFKYFNIDKVIVDFIVWSPDGTKVDSWKH
jgi:hypothetical protein